MKLTKYALVAVIGSSLAFPAVSQPGPGGGRYAFSNNNTPGWSLMTPEERSTHQQKMWSFKTYDECKAYQAEHHQLMESRAKEQGKTLPVPRANACDRMKSSGMLK
ncbi:conserved exported hypothetical protein [Candidatus Propionivibrio aalborgensis]|jgi:hypothetical protein|uniref:Uncharacterized protein n=1 Tax=Candidatus Propionivibrio aalborgensis TaxID=1860101 RepID=A0A1A8XH06_9RHOO|nr:hypothetical protein [Candidatus Propionivibrio aalborgensis]SBT04440.1 conserved exported hypothetical protein [Candidatus Propionivibrio aalborgensis]